MKRILSLDFVGNYVHAAVLASGGTGRWRVAQQMSDKLPENIFAAKPSQAKIDEIGAWLAKKLDLAGIRESRAIVGLGRTLLNAKLLQVPPAPDHELPSIVRFAAEADGSLGDAILDYAPITIIKPMVDANGNTIADDSAPVSNEKQVFATWISPTTLQTLVGLLKAAKLSLQGVTARAFGLFDAAQRSHHFFGKNSVLLAEWNQDQVELTGWVSGSLVAYRTLAVHEPEQATRRIVGEITRTLGAVQSAFPGEAIEFVGLLGPFTPALRDAIMNATGAKAEVIEPERDLEIEVPAGQVGIVPALGLAASEVAPRVNWLDPKKTVVQENPNRLRTIALAGLAAAGVLAGGFYFRSQYLDRADKIANIDDQIANFDSQLRSKKPILDRHQKTKSWVQTNVHWLRELNALAMSLPDTSKAYLEKIELKAGDEKLPAKIHLDGFASSPEVITSLFEKWGGLKQDVPLAAAVPGNGRTLLPVDAKAKGLRTLSGKDTVGKESLVVASKTSPAPAVQVPVKDAKSAPATKTAVGKSASKEVAKQSRYRISPNGTEQNGQISGFAHRFMPDITLTEPISDAEYQTVTADWKSALAKLTPTGMRRETVSLQTRTSTPRGPSASPAVANGVPTTEVSGAPGVATPATGGPVVIGAPGGASPVMNVTGASSGGGDAPAEEGSAFDKLAAPLVEKSFEEREAAIKKMPESLQNKVRDRVKALAEKKGG